MCEQACFSCLAKEKQWLFSWMKMYLVEQVHWLVPCCYLHGSPGEVPPAITTASSLTWDPPATKGWQSTHQATRFLSPKFGSLYNIIELQATFLQLNCFSWATRISSCSMCCQMKSWGKKISDCQAIHLEKPPACRKGQKGSGSAWKLNFTKGEGNM